MAFWKKSDDPWDRKPGRRQTPADWNAEETDPAPGLLDQLKDWNEGRKAGQTRKAAEETPAPIPCPWCGRDMETGQLTGSRGVFWAAGFPTTREKWIGSAQRKQIRVDTEGVFYTYRTAWFCENCRRLVADFPEEPALTPWEEKLDQYAEQANKREEEN